MRIDLIPSASGSPVWHFITSRKRLVFSLLSAFCISALLFSSLSDDDGVVSRTFSSPASPQSANASASAVKVWQQLQPLLDRYKPNVEPAKINKAAESHRYKPDDTSELTGWAEMSAKDVWDMHAAHTGFIDDMRTAMPHYESVHGAPKRGIVTTAGGWYSPIMMVSLRMLRKAGSQLPVEVFMADRSEYEADLCEKVLPSMNARCLVLSDILDSDPNHMPQGGIKKYQYKIFSILFSSFDEILFLDADSFPLHNIDHMFSTDPFKSTGMVTWPDFWALSISPIYYLISGQEPVKTSVRASTESGQLLVSKRTHWHTLLLAAYYNYHADHYYPILCEGGAGRGDKGTFIPAAMHLKQDFYDVREPVVGTGHDVGGHLYIFAMIQADPVEDFAIHRGNSSRKGLLTLPWHRRDEPETAAAERVRPRPLFLHTNTPKWNPKNIFDHPGAYDLTHKSGHESPAYADPPEAVALIPGVERSMWDEVRWVSCKLTFADWDDAPGICHRVEEHIDKLNEEADKIEKAKAPPSLLAGVNT